MRDSTAQQNTKSRIGGNGEFRHFPTGRRTWGFPFGRPIGRVLHPYIDGFYEKNITSQRQERIETYARSVGGKYRDTPCACNIPTSPPSIPVVPGKSDPVAEEMSSGEVCDTLASDDVSENVDPSLTDMLQMWQTLAPTLPEGNPQGVGVLRRYFDSTIHGRLWIEYGGPRRGDLFPRYGA